MKIKYFAILMMVMLGVVSCKKKDEEGPAITFNSPVSTQTLVNGETMSISVSVSDNEGLHMATVSLINTSASDTVLWTMGGHTHDNPAVISGTYMIDVPLNSELELEVEAEDETGNVTSDHLHFHIMN